MSKTTFSNKCEILGSLWFWHKETDNEVWAEFFQFGDIGLPLAYFVKEGYATATKEDGHRTIEECWNIFCEMIDIDPELRYTSLEDAFSASEKNPLK